MTSSRTRTILLAVMILVFGLWITIHISKPDGMWIYILTTLLCVVFIDESIKFIKSKKGFWESLSPHDKLLTFMGSVLIFVFSLFPMEIGMSLGVVPIFILIGYTLTWLFIKKFGSKSLKEKILWPKP